MSRAWVVVTAVGLQMVLVGAGSAAWAQGTGVSHELAVSRAARVSDVRYALAFTAGRDQREIPGRETLTFTDSGAGDLALDYREGKVATATLNGKAIATTLEDGHLHLPGEVLVHGANELKVEFASGVASAGKAFTRYTDRDDHQQYLYTLFVPMDASMAFPCFDQPDLKARFTLEVTAPQDWTVIANTMPERMEVAGKPAVWSFPESRPISTYLFAFAAGPWAAVKGSAPGEPTVYARQSQLGRAKQEAPQVQQMAARGIAWFSSYFAQPFPFPKYDLVLIPGFPFGGMEHAGETFLNEDGVLFRTAPTEADYFHRNTLVLHETCHQWFGDLVTMRWFDDLWLKEGFAQYMAYKALAELEPGERPWKHFYEEIKPVAYGIDETEGTTPIFQNIANLKDAKSAYGAIVYQKAPAVLKQLNYFLGEESFRGGLRLYLKEHAYGNAQWADLIGAFERASVAAGQKKDVQGWARAWILQRGMPEVTTTTVCRAGKIVSLTLQQRDVLGAGHLWPISNEILLDGETAQTPDAATTLRVSWSTANDAVAAAEGRPCPQLVFANEGDYGYGRFLLEKGSATTAATLLDPGTAEREPSELRSSVAEAAEPLRRSMLWGALWENVRVTEASPKSYVQLALTSLPTEQDESLARINGGRVAQSLHAYMGDKGRAMYAPEIEATAAARMQDAPTLGLRIVSFRTFTSVAETPSALGLLKAMLAGTLTVPGMPLKPLDRWNILARLVAMNDPEAATLYAAEQAKDKSGEGQKYAYAVGAGVPDAAVKARYFAEYLQQPGTAGARQEDWLQASLGNFNSWNQSGLTAPYLTQALNALGQIKQQRKIFFLGAWLGSFMGGQHSVGAQRAVEGWLAAQGAGLDPDLRLKVLEVADALDRTVRIRARWPE